MAATAPATLMAHRGLDNAHGDLKERRAKMDAKYDLAVEKGLRNWIEGVTGDKIGDDFQESLKDGEILCNLINKLSPGSAKYSKSKLAFKQMENIGQFLGALPAFGLRSEDLFQTPDLYEGTNMSQVQLTLGQVQRVAQIKEGGGSVAAQPKPASLLMPEGKLSKDIPVKTSPGPVRKFDSYERDGKDIANSGGPKPTTSNRANDNAFGDLAERRAKMESKYDKGLEAGLRKWLEGLTGETIAEDFHEGLKDGKIICTAMNKLGSSIKINNNKMAFKQMENISHFLEAAKAYGVRSEDLFQTADLYEGTNMAVVLQTLDNVQRISQSK